MANIPRGRIMQTGTIAVGSVRSKYLLKCITGRAVDVRANISTGPRSDVQFPRSGYSGNQIEIESIEIEFPLIIGRSTVTLFPLGLSKAREKLPCSRAPSDERGCISRIRQIRSARQDNRTVELSSRIKPAMNNHRYTYNCGDSADSISVFY